MGTRESTRAWMLVFLLGAIPTAQGGWGPLTGAVQPASGATQASLVMLTSAASSVGMSPPASPDGSTLAGVPTFEFNLPDSNYAGYFTDDAGTGPAIAFNTSDWGNLQEPLDPHLVVQYVATAYHELAHVNYGAFYGNWCLQNPFACSSFADCIAGLTHPGGEPKGYSALEDNPCSEAYANGVTAASLCEDKLAICENGDLSPVQREAFLDEIDLAMAQVAADCEAQLTDCLLCDGPMPGSFPGCAPESCECP